jgi:hypothetical protein
MARGSTVLRRSGRGPSPAESRTGSHHAEDVRNTMDRRLGTMHITTKDVVATGGAAFTPGPLHRAALATGIGALAAQTDRHASLQPV